MKELEKYTFIIQDSCLIRIRTDIFKSNLTELYDENNNNCEDFELLGFENKQELFEILDCYLKGLKGKHIENIINKVVEIEDYNGNTLMAIETDEGGKIIKFVDCEIADITDDYLFDTDKDLIRIQKIGVE